MIPLYGYSGRWKYALFPTKFLILFSAFLAFLPIGSAFAIDWSLTPSVTLSEMYDSNVRFSSRTPAGSSKSDFITNLTPIISVSGESERTKIKIDTVTQGQKYVNNPHYDTINTDTKASVSYLWSPRLSTDANFGFIHDWTLDDQVEKSGITTVRTERFHYDLGFGGKYALTEPLFLQARAAVGLTTYPSGLLQDQTTFQANLTPVWSLSHRDSIGLSSSYVYADYSNNVNTLPGYSNQADISTFSEMLYFQRLLSETLSFKFGAGYQYTSANHRELGINSYPPPLFTSIKVNSDDSSPVFMAEVKKDWTERFTTTVSANMEEYSDVNARSFEKTSFRGSGKYRLSELTSVLFDAKYDMNSQNANGSEEITYYRLCPAIQRDISESLVITFAGSYEHETDKNFGGINGNESHVERFRTWAELTYKWPRFLASH
ncbi:MAG: hypothetical protein LLG06_16010 [Desulfobacteraceae bacterium]|nr:hypothetical protein [Desulfobacteraceae bacterium]